MTLIIEFVTRTWVRCLLRQQGPGEHQGTASAFSVQVPPGLVVKPWSELANRVGGVCGRVRKASIIHWDLRNLKFKALVKTKQNKPWCVCVSSLKEGFSL